jgi:hypothetical protein
MGMGRTPPTRSTSRVSMARMHLADLVEEQRAAGGRLQEPGLADRAGERRATDRADAGLAADDDAHRERAMAGGDGLLLGGRETRHAKEGAVAAAQIGHRGAPAAEPHPRVLA